MTTAFRSDNDTTNGTAGTSVTVNKPSGLVDTGDERDVMVAFISATGAPSITPPADWDLVTSAVDAGSGVTMWAYTKVADAEGASWTWTLGTSQRNWGWVGAFSGVDPDSPVADFDTDLTLTTNTTLSVTLDILPLRGHGVAAGSAVRTASGVATTWTHSSTEVSDVSTNGGAGTDIAGVVGHTANPLDFESAYAPEVIASQSQTAGVLIALSLTPYFYPYDATVGGAGIVVEAAFGADPDGDPDDYSWTDVTEKVHHPAKIVLRHGRSNRSLVADPSEMRFTLLNLSGEWTLPGGTYTDDFVRNLPFRVRLTGFGLDPGNWYYQRGLFFLAAASPRWDETTNFSVIDVVASGRLRRLQQRTEPVKSPAYTAITGQDELIAYWPFEDGSGATRAASAIPGVDSAQALEVTFGGSAEGTGAASLAELTATSNVEGILPSYVDNGLWTATVVFVIPSEPAAEMLLLEVLTTGTAPRWQITVAPGSPSALHIRAYDSSVVSILDDSVSLDESTLYGFGQLFTISTTQNGTGVDYLVEATHSSGGVSKSGTLASRTNGAIQKLRIASPQYTDERFGHVAAFADVPDLGYGFLVGSGVIDANTGETPATRFGRIVTEAGTHGFADSETEIDTTMGPQPVDSSMNILRESENVSLTAITDSGESGGVGGYLWLPALSDRLNLDASLTLDVAQGQVAPGFRPMLDDQDIVNDVEVRREDGSFARVTDETSIARDGRYKEQATVNTEADDPLIDLAGWRLNLGTVAGMRYPQVSWNLRSSPELAEEWVNTTLFDRVDILNPPSQYPPDDIRALLEGYTETLAQDEWTVTAYLSPYSPYEVFELAETSSDQNEWAGRLAEDEQAALRAAVDDNDTSFGLDPNFYRWTTTADDFDPDLKVRLGGEVVEVSSIATTAATYVAAGAASHADNASVSPALYAGHTANDWIFVFARHRSSGTLTTPTDYTLLANIRGLYLWAKVHDGTEAAPAVAPSGGASGDTVSAMTFGFRNMPITLDDMTDAVMASVTQINSSAANIAYPGVYPILQAGCIILLLAGRSDDWTSVAMPSSMTAEIVDTSTTTGDDQGIYGAYVIQTTPAVVNDGTLTVTGGASANNESMILAIAGGFQTLTVSNRSVNGVVRSHAAGSRMAIEDAFVLGP